MTSPLYAAATALGVELSASLIAVEPGERLAFARGCAAAGRWVHTDVIEGSFRGQPGIGVEEIAGIAAIPGVLLDVHLMCDDPEGVISTLPRVTRITVHDTGAPTHDAAIAAGRLTADAVWESVEALRPMPGSGDGTLLMLTPPGQPGFEADLDRIDGPPATAWGVDGGVNAANLSHIAATGATYIVVGRGLHAH